MSCNCITLRSTMDLDSVSNSPKTEKGIEQLSQSGQSSTSPKFSLNSQRKAKNTTPVSVPSGSISEHIETMPKNHSSHGRVASPKAIPKEDVSGGPCASVAFSSKDEKENEDKRSRLLSNAQKVDKFGRLVREGASDSESDDSHRARKRGRSRSRSQSRSRSPLDMRRRRRRSPRRRGEIRSRSRSWSPRNRRSRSRSPSFKQAGRRDRGQIPDCFDFRRGRCYRGASCRFMHHASQKSERSTHHKSKQLAPCSKNYRSLDDYNKLSPKASYHEQETINQQVQYNHDISVVHARKDDIGIHNREDSVNITVVDSENLREVADEVPISLVEEQKAMDADQVVASKEVLSSSKNSIEQSQINVLDPVILNADETAQATDDSSISDLSPNQTSKPSPKKLCVGEIIPNVDSMQNSSQLPPLITSGPNVESNSAPQIPVDYNLIHHQTATNQSQSASLETFPSYMLPPPPPPPPPPMPLPLPPPALNFGTAPMGVTYHFQQSGLPPRSDFGFQMLRPYSTGIPHIGDFQHKSYPPVHEPHQSLLHGEGYRLNPLPGSRPSDSKFGVTGLLEEDSIKRYPVQGLSASNAFAQSSNYPQPTLQESPSGDIPKSSQVHPYLHQQQFPYDLHHSGPTVYGVPGKISASSRDFQDRNQPDYGVTRSSIHFNPYASTFEKPLSSRFSSNVFLSEKDLTYSNKHECPSSLSHVSVDEKGLPRPVDDQYDPLFDSIEPSNSHKKSDYIHKWEPPGSSDIVPRLKESDLPLDVEEENNKIKDFGSVALAPSPDNEEFGETKVGDVENGSLSDPDQINTSPGKRKKSKESRSMKLFKVCLAGFVKEVLKPSWRQGNMSKEAFKTVVKKTVDKVSGAMKNHQVPKSKAKINQYIDSSQRKLTKLVMGYVDKYARG